MDVLARILELPLIGILRGFGPDHLPKIVQAVAEGGLRNVEITMNTPGASSQIREARRWSGERLQIGAGTVTSVDLLEEALEAGASFIVTPAVNGEVISACVRRNVPIFPGAFSPSEVVKARDLGASMVKIFPGDLGGPAYVHLLRGAFPGIRLLPTGGVDLATAPEFLRAGAAGLGVGSPLFDKGRIDSADWEWLRARARAFVNLF